MNYLYSLIVLYFIGELSSSSYGFYSGQFNNDLTRRFTLLFPTVKNIQFKKNTEIRKHQILLTRKEFKLYGIPKLFRWLVELYPLVLESVGEGITQNSGCDNFYLDMNGIIHSCTHSNNDKLIVLNEQVKQYIMG